MNKFASNQTLSLVFAQYIFPWYLFVIFFRRNKLIPSLLTQKEGTGDDLDAFRKNTQSHIN